MSAPVEQIERELEETRAQAARTAQALRHKLTPRQLTREVLNSQAARHMERVLTRWLPWVAAGLTLLAIIRTSRR